MTNTKFLLLGGQRTGTTFIDDCLNSHPDIVCLNELFALHRRADDCYATWMKSSLGRRAKHVLLRRRAVFEFLNETFAAKRRKAVGFKFMYGQSRKFPYRFPQVLSYAAIYRLKVVHIIRRNYLRTLISRETAASSRVYHVTKKVGVRKIRLDPERLVTRLGELRREEQHWRSRLRHYDHINVYYEDFVAERQEEGDRICSFLGVEVGAKLQSSLVKINPSRLEDVVENYGAVEAQLRNSDFEFCLG